METQVFRNIEMHSLKQYFISKFQTSKHSKQKPEALNPGNQLILQAQRMSQLSLIEWSKYDLQIWLHYSVKVPSSISYTFLKKKIDGKSFCALSALDFSNFISSPQIIKKILFSRDAVLSQERNQRQIDSFQDSSLSETSNPSPVPQNSTPSPSSSPTSPPNQITVKNLDSTLQLSSDYPESGIFIAPLNIPSVSPPIPVNSHLSAFLRFSVRDQPHLSSHLSSPLTPQISSKAAKTIFCKSIYQTSLSYKDFAAVSKHSNEFAEEAINSLQQFSKSKSAIF